MLNMTSAANIISTLVIPDTFESVLASECETYHVQCFAVHVTSDRWNKNKGINIRTL